MFGAHLSIAGGLENALIEAAELGMDCVQIFTKNQRQWKAPPLTEDQVGRWKSHQASTRIRHTVSHASYLINLASPDRTTRNRSMRLFHKELLRCASLGIPHLVTHPGAHMGRGIAAGLRRVADALNRIHDQLPDLPVITCLENTAGQGTSLGVCFEELAEMIDRVEADDRLGICLDTAHLLAAGFDLTSDRGTRAMLRAAGRALGLPRVMVLHVNDSKTKRGSRRDRHEHIGRGHVATEAFSVLVNHRAFKHVPKILETPKGSGPDGRPWDTINIERLCALVKHKRPGRTRRTR